MSLPTEADFALIKMGDGADPEVFTQVCGIQDVTINKQAQTTDRYVRDCTKPGAVPTRRTKVNGKMLDVSGSGLSNVDEIARLEAALGEVKNYKIELYAEDGTDTGTLLGTYGGAFRMTTDNMTVPRANEASAQMNLASDGDWTYTAA